MTPPVSVPPVTPLPAAHLASAHTHTLTTYTADTMMPLPVTASGPSVPSHSADTTRSTVSAFQIFRSRVKQHPRPYVILAVLVWVMILDIVGLVLYMIAVPDGNVGPITLVNALFILVLVAVFALMFRQALIIHRINHPPSLEQELRIGRPTWLAVLPTYRDVMRTERRRGGGTDVEGWKGDLPAYGDTRGSELLMKNISNGVDRGQV